ncbi:MAG: hypothetical protein QOG20_4553 [Pseudonocardiales bacterium]|nr:hypothetical protein [Pseudonocardiales bacterium]
MASISWTRRSYEAAVLLLPLDPAARVWLMGQDAGETEGLVVADERLAQPSGPPDPVPPTGEGVATSSPLEHAVHAADVVVLLAHDLAAVDVEAVVRIGDAARATGTLLGAVVVSPGARWTDPASERSAAAIREAADSVVVLDDGRLALPFLQVLRGGARAVDLVGGSA